MSGAGICDGSAPYNHHGKCMVAVRSVNGIKREQ